MSGPINAEELAIMRERAKLAKADHPENTIQLWRIEGPDIGMDRVSIIGNAISPAMIDNWRRDGSVCTLIEEVQA